MQIIHRLTAVSNPTRVFEVGTEIEGREVIEIKRYSEDSYCEYHVLDGDGNLIAIVDNAPAILDWKTIVVDGPRPERVEKCFYYEEQLGTEVKFGKPCCFICVTQEIRSSAPLHTMSDEQKAGHLKLGMQAIKLAFSENEE